MLTIQTSYSVSYVLNLMLVTLLLSSRLFAIQSSAFSPHSMRSQSVENPLFSKPWSPNSLPTHHRLSHSTTFKNSLMLPNATHTLTHIWSRNLRFCRRRWKRCDCFESKAGSNLYKNSCADSMDVSMGLEEHMTTTRIGLLRTVLEFPWELFEQEETLHIACRNTMFRRGNCRGNGFNELRTCIGMIIVALDIKSCRPEADILECRDPVPGSATSGQVSKGGISQ